MASRSKLRQKALKRDQGFRDYKATHPEATLDEIARHFNNRWSRDTVRVALNAAKPTA